MANKIMKTLTMDGVTYEIVDGVVRDRIDTLEQNLHTISTTGSWNDLEDKPVFNNITDIEIEQICKSVNAVTVFNDAKLGSTMI